MALEPYSRAAYDPGETGEEVPPNHLGGGVCDVPSRPGGAQYPVPLRPTRGPHPPLRREPAPVT